MSREDIVPKSDVGDDGLSASERDKKANIDRLYRWIKSLKRRS